MSIQYSETKKIFTLHTKHSTYQMKADSYGNLLHLYYGDRTDGSMEYLLTCKDHGFSPNPYEAGKDRTYSMDAQPQEFPYQGSGDFRSSAFAVEHADGSYGLTLHYDRYEISEGKYSLPGLPSMYAETTGAADTLCIFLVDHLSGLTLTLLYSVFPEYDVITRAVCVENGGTTPVSLKRIYSATLDFLHGSYDLISFHGRHQMERNYQRTPVTHIAQIIGSRRGTSSHQYNPFIILADSKTTETSGACYGMSFVYSGAFKAEAEMDQFEQIRISMGLQDEEFSYDLGAGEVFWSPEVILSYSSCGLGTLSRNYHKAIRHNICRGKYKTAPRPILINNWEATYFDFDGRQILNIAEKAHALGVEMMVLDDGWFGKRDSDFSGLGDWQVNEKKLGSSLANLVKQINDLGMKFGIWFEPEMVSEDSNLYRQHPDWTLAIPGRKPLRSRSQLVLDFSRSEVVDYIFDSMCHVLDHAYIEYLKWDMNRSIADVYSMTSANVLNVKKQNPGTILYRYVLGLYDLLERITSRYPDLLIEGCSGGGGRFDAGMLYYTPQIWCSDNTDAIERITIQHGTSFGYPISALSSHVSAVPNHQTGRLTSMDTRGVVAMAGNFGYELNLDNISEEEKKSVRLQIDQYHKYWNLIHSGDYYRLTNPCEGQTPAAWLFVSEDRQEALLNVVTLDIHANAPIFYVRLEGLDPQSIYQNTATGIRYPGAALMSAGIPIPDMKGEYQAWQVHFRIV